MELEKPNTTAESLSGKERDALRKNLEIAAAVIEDMYGPTVVTRCDRDVVPAVDLHIEGDEYHVRLDTWRDLNHQVEAMFMAGDAAHDEELERALVSECLTIIALDTPGDEKAIIDRRQCAYFTANPAAPIVAISESGDAYIVEYHVDDENRFIDFRLVHPEIEEFDFDGHILDLICEGKLKPLSEVVAKGVRGYLADSIWDEL